MIETLQPAADGLVERAGATLHYQVYGLAGTTAPTLVFVPAFGVMSGGTLHRSQVPMFSRRHRCVVYDGLGTGTSSPVTEPNRLTLDQWVADLVAVVDELGIDRFVAVGQSLGGMIALLAAATEPERVLGVVGIGASTVWDDQQPRSVWIDSFDETRDSYHGWDRWNAHSIRSDYEGFLTFFASQAHNRVHPEAEIARIVELAHRESDPETVIAFIRTTLRGPDPERLEQTLSAIDCPVLLIHGDDDRIVPVRYVHRTAQVLGVEPTILPGGSHSLAFRRAPEVNESIDDWLDRFRSDTAQPIPKGPARRSPGPRILYLSSPIGLGHIRRDLAIAGEVRKLAPDVQIDWLSQEPVTAVLSEADERVHPAARLLVSENAHLARQATDHGLDAVRAAMAMDEILATNYFVFQDVVNERAYDLVIGDEAWEIDTYWLDNPSAKRARYAWLTDFVGELPLPGFGADATSLVRARNGRMIHNLEHHPEVRDLSLFIGTPDDIIDDTFGDGLPDIRPWVVDQFDFSGYITGFDPTTLPTRDEIRARHGVSIDEALVVAAVGGSGIGGSLLNTVATAHQNLHRTKPGLRTILVAGPRIPTSQFGHTPGLDVRGWVPDLHHLLAAGDAAVVQGGLTTTMELTAAGTPFLYAPLDGHFEQQLHVPHRLNQHRAGRRIAHDIRSEELTELLKQIIDLPTDYEPIPADGATRAAQLIAQLL